MTGVLSVCMLVEGDFAAPEVLVDCDPEERAQESGGEANFDYEVYLMPGAYRVIAYDVLHKVQFEQDIVIDGRGEQKMHITLEPS